MEDDLLINRGRLLDDTTNLYPPGPPGAEGDNFEMHDSGNWNSGAPPSPSSKKRSPSRRDRKSKSRDRPRERDRKSRSRSRGRGRRTPSRSPDRRSSRRRYGGRDDKVRRSRSRGHIRSRSRGRENSRDQGRYRGRGRRTPSPPNRSRWPSSQDPSQNSMPIAPPPPVVSLNPNQYQGHMFNDGYNNFGMAYGQPQQQYASYDAYNTAPLQAAGFAPSYPPPPPVLSQPIPPGDDFPAAPAWGVPPPPVINTQPPPIPALVAAAPVPQVIDEGKLKREAAVAQEMQNQRAQLKKQRDDYQKRASALRRELKILKDQKDDLVSGNEPPSPTTKGFVKENDRLQIQIQNKLNTIENVIDMLSGIIGEDSVDQMVHQQQQQQQQQPPSPKVSQKKKRPAPGEDSDSSSEKLKLKLLEKMQKNTGHEAAIKEEPIKPSEKNRVNYVHYDPETHWCQHCDAFPKSAKDYLLHLQSKEHIDIIRDLDEPSPWHDTFNTDEFSTYANAPTKRVPIRGLQFFVPSTAWYCKLCAIWMGDLRCASLHLKSKTHSEKYNQFIEFNPNFETDWANDRQLSFDQYNDIIPQMSGNSSGAKSHVTTDPNELLSFEGIPLQIKQNVKPIVEQPIVETTSKSEGEKKSKKKKAIESKKEKKRKKKSKKRRESSSSSSSSSDSSASDTDRGSPTKTDDESNADKSNSIRVAMRNILKSQKQQALDETGRWTIIQQGRTQSPIPQAPPPPTVSTEGKKRDEMIMSQWATPDPIISESEKKLLDDLKGKLKSKNVPPPPPPAKEESKDEKRRDRERDRDRENNVKERGSNEGNRLNRDRDRDRDRDYNRDRPRDFDRRINDRRRRSRSRSRSRHRRSRSRSPLNRRFRGRNRPYSRSRSRSRPRIIEKPVINFPPEPRPRPEKKIRQLKNDEDSKKSPGSKAKKTVMPPGGKKLPFIGRMPVFKKQTAANEAADRKLEATVAAAATTVPAESEGPENREVYGPPPPPAAQASTTYVMDNSEMKHMMMEDDDDLMPDPAQLMAIMAAAPPPPPRTPMPQQNNEIVLPPGIDETEADSVPKPISDAPRPRKGPLPKDFQDALNIIFPGEKKPDAAPVPKPIEKTNETHEPAIMPTDPTMIMPDEISQQSIDMYNAYAAANAAYPNQQAQVYAMYEQHPSADLPLDILPVPPPPPASIDPAIINPIAIGEIVIEEKNGDLPQEMEEVKVTKINKKELDELAMLGIDADDLAAQCM